MGAGEEDVGAAVGEGSGVLVEVASSTTVDGATTSVATAGSGLAVCWGVDCSTVGVGGGGGPPPQATRRTATRSAVIHAQAWTCFIARLPPCSIARHCTASARTLNKTGGVPLSWRNAAAVPGRPRGEATRHPRSRSARWGGGRPLRRGVGGRRDAGPGGRGGHGRLGPLGAEAPGGAGRRRSRPRDPDRGDRSHDLRRYVGRL